MGDIKQPQTARHMENFEAREIGVVVKGDVVGSVEVVVDVLEKRQPEGLLVRVVQSGVGPVSESDVDMAASTGSEL